MRRGWPQNPDAVADGDGISQGTLLPLTVCASVLSSLRGNFPPGTWDEIWAEMEAVWRQRNYLKKAYVSTDWICWFSASCHPISITFEQFLCVKKAPVFFTRFFFIHLHHIWAVFVRGSKLFLSLDSSWNKLSMVANPNPRHLSSQVIRCAQLINHVP